MKFSGLDILAVAGEFHTKTKIGWSLSTNSETQIELEKVADAHLALTGGDVSSVCQFTVGGTASLATTTIYGHLSSDEAMVIQTAAGQAANALLIQDSAAAEIFSVGSTGIVTALQVLGSDPTLTIKGTTSVYLQAGAATLMGVFSTSVWLWTDIHSSTDGAQDCGTALKKWGNVWTNKITVNGATSLGTGTIYGHDADSPAMVIQTAASQTVDALLIQDSTAAEIFSVDATGISFSGDTFISRDAANVIAQSNGVTAQESRFYETDDGTQTDYVRSYKRWSGYNLQMGLEDAGTESGNAGAIQFFHPGNNTGRTVEVHDVNGLVFAVGNGPGLELRAPSGGSDTVLISMYDEGTSEGTMGLTGGDFAFYNTSPTGTFIFTSDGDAGTTTWTMADGGGFYVPGGIGLHGVAPPEQAAHIASMTSTSDTQYRDGINSILVALENMGLLATS